MEATTVIGIVLGVGIGVLVGWWIGSVRGRPRLGALLGVLGLIGWVIIALMPRNYSPYGRPVDADLHVDASSHPPHPQR